MKSLDVLMGFHDVSLAIVTRDDPEGYACKAAVPIPGAVRLRRDWSGMTRAAFSDDGALERVRSLGGVHAELRLSGADPVRLAELGLWIRGEESGMYHDGLPRGGRAYSLRFVGDSVNNAEYCCKYRVFLVESIHLDEFVTRGHASGNTSILNEWIIQGALYAPKCDRVRWRAAFRMDSSGYDESARKEFLLGAESL